MRPWRNFKTNQCCHLISRIANRAFFLNDEKKTRFVERLWRVATFSCVEVLAYCFMSNHFHILVYVPHFRQYKDGTPHMIKSFELVPVCPLDPEHANGIFRKWL